MTVDEARHILGTDAADEIAARPSPRLSDRQLDVACRVLVDDVAPDLHSDAA